MQSRYPRRRQRGFSLAELIVVLSIIAVLSALVASRMTYHRVRSMNAACNALMSLIKRAADAYYAETGGKIPDVVNLVTTGYLTEAPRDPHDSPVEYQILEWDGEQVKVECPKSRPGAVIIFPPGHS